MLTHTIPPGLIAELTSLVLALMAMTRAAPHEALAPVAVPPRSNHSTDSRSARGAYHA